MGLPTRTAIGQRSQWLREGGMGRQLSPSRRRDCHFADALTLSLLKHLLKLEEVAAE